MRILHLVSYPLFSGPLVPTFELAMAQRQAGHRVWLGYDTKRGHQDAFEEAAAPVIDAASCAPPLPLSLSSKSNPLELWRDVRLLRQLCGDLDVMHTHLSHDHCLAVFARSMDHVLVVRTMHHARSLTQRFGQRWLLRHAHGLICRCAESQQRLGALTGNPSRCHMIPGGVATQRFAPFDAAKRHTARRRFALPKNAKVIVHAALMAHRGQEELAGALVRINREDVHVLFVGNGEQRAALEIMTRAMGLGDKVHFTGYLRGDHLLDAYAAADLAFVGQVGNDASGRSALEPMACRIPVAAVSTGALQQSVTQERGYPIEVLSPEPIANALRLWLQDAKIQRDAKVSCAYNFIQATRSRKMEAAATVAFYQSLMS